MHKYKTGFTIIELMIVVAVIGILASVAYPSYTNYVKRGKIAEATSTLSELRLRAEKFFADNRTYAGFPDVINGTRYFTYTCPTKTATTFQCNAVGIAGQGMGGFTYTINESNVRTSAFVGQAGWNNSATCWVLKAGDSC